MLTSPKVTGSDSMLSFAPCSKTNFSTRYFLRWQRQIVFMIKGLCASFSSMVYWHEFCNINCILIRLGSNMHKLIYKYYLLRFVYKEWVISFALFRFKPKGNSACNLFSYFLQSYVHRLKSSLLGLVHIRVEIPEQRQHFV